ncbi:MAG: radical SAM family heme chaperone HemW [Bacteroidetes bacterium]|nr:radical SAM family heme chaperone HemW [Bacteroidota bacterium]
MASLYLHIPYCEHKCIYCDFYSVENMNSMERFLQALQQEIIFRGEEFAPKESIETIFFGGGTPSLLSPQAMEKILGTVLKYFQVDADAEITTEANPGTVTREKLRAYRSLGINRISFGVQSFHSDELKFLTRIHSAEEAEQAVRDAYAAGFDNVSLDLIFSLPNQTPEKWNETLARAAALQPKHISAYSLIVEDNTPLSVMVKNKLVAPLPEDIDAAIYESTMEQLSRFGFQQYEISNYALPGFESRHNKNYWNHTNYLGFGPSAHSFWREEPLTGTRWWNVRSIQSYCGHLEEKKNPVSGNEQLTKETLLNEEIFLGLRSSGIRLDVLANIFQTDFLKTNEAKVHDYLSRGLMKQENNTLSLTAKGYVLCDAIAESFIV